VAFSFWLRHLLVTDYMEFTNTHHDSLKCPRPLVSMYECASMDNFQLVQITALSYWHWFNFKW